MRLELARARALEGFRAGEGYQPGDPPRAAMTSGPRFPPTPEFMQQIQAARKTYKHKCILAFFK
jgi:hypothetical protein